MRKIDGTEALKQMLNVFKKKCEIEEGLRKVGIFAEDMFDKLGDEIYETVRKMIDGPKGVDWISDAVYDYGIGEISLEQAMEKLLEE